MNKHLNVNSLARGHHVWCNLFPNIIIVGTQPGEGKRDGGGMGWGGVGVKDRRG